MIVFQVIVALTLDRKVENHAIYNRGGKIDDELI
jgi:hypothetical protein